MSAPNVVGLDLSITATGVALVDGTTETLTMRAADGDLRLCAIAGRIADRTIPAVGADKVDAETKLKADFLLDCGHIANRPVCFHVSDHRRGNYSATTCPSCPAAGADLAAVCPAAAAQFDAAGSNPPPPPGSPPGRS
jgi:hypothetical protein